MRRLGRIAVFILSVLSSVITIAVAYYDLGDQASADGRFAIGILAVLLLGALLLLVLQEYRYARKARYAESLSLLDAAVAHAAVWRLEHDQPQNPPGVREIQTELNELVRRVAEAFTLITGVRVDCCIKTVDVEGEGDAAQPYAVDAARDPRSARDRETRRERAQERGIRHYIRENTDFRSIFFRKEGYFLSNALPLRHFRYNNTSFEIDGEPPKMGVPLIDDLWRHFRWPLPYRSTVVVPVVDHPADLPGRESRKILGFLCIDSRSTGVFESRYDVPLLRTYAELVAPVLNYNISARWEEAGRGAIAQGG